MKPMPDKPVHLGDPLSQPVPFWVSVATVALFMVPLAIGAILLIVWH
ncbi:hypothetical protein LCGC14_1996480 [marine sediment metagenome]|uniref:Uncharacterized protein n=1 Tax=marine sediment metagenome TaxID=412755 RepID=A0A0F9F4D9_9ZZZZ